MKKVFVTGIHGQLCKSLADLAGEYPELNMVFNGRPEFDLGATAKAERIVHDAKPDLILNAAAYTAVDKAESEPDLAFAVNCEGAAAMARVARDLDIPIIHVSTDYVFSGQSSNPYVETDATGPLGIYGASKLAGEDAVRNITSKHCILRTSWVYSEHGNNFVKTMLRLGAERETLRVVADQRGCPTFAGDLAAAALAIVTVLGGVQKSFGTFHAAGQGTTTWAELAKEIFAVKSRMGLSVPRIESITTGDYPTPARRPMNSVLDCSKLADVFGIVLPPWQQSLRGCVESLLVNADQPA
jgi:dTDP-4-dehydrorhamnose reductase